MNAKNNVLSFRPKTKKPSARLWNIADLLGLKDGCRVFKMRRGNAYFSFEKGDLIVADFNEKPKGSEPGVFVFPDRVDVAPSYEGVNARALIEYGKIVAVIKLVV